MNFDNRFKANAFSLLLTFSMFTVSCNNDAVPQNPENQTKPKIVLVEPEAGEPKPEGYTPSSPSWNDGPAGPVEVIDSKGNSITVERGSRVLLQGDDSEIPLLLHVSSNYYSFEMVLDDHEFLLDSLGRVKIIEPETKPDADPEKQQKPTYEH